MEDEAPTAVDRGSAEAALDDRTDEVLSDRGSESGSEIPPLAPPNAPEVIADSDTSVTLLWNTSSPAPNYKLQQSADGGEWADIFVGNDGRSRDVHEVTGLQPGVSYRFRVCALADNGTQSDFSEPSSGHAMGAAAAVGAAEEEEDDDQHQGDDGQNLDGIDEESVIKVQSLARRRLAQKAAEERRAAKESGEDNAVDDIDEESVVKVQSLARRRLAQKQLEKRRQGAAEGERDSEESHEAKTSVRSFVDIRENPIALLSSLAEDEDEEDDESDASDGEAGDGEPGAGRDSDEQDNEDLASIRNTAAAEYEDVREYAQDLDELRRRLESKELRRRGSDLESVLSGVSDASSSIAGQQAAAGKLRQLVRQHTELQQAVQQRLDASIVARAGTPEISAATAVQAAFRGHKARRDIEGKERAVVAIQAAERGRQARRRVERIRADARPRGADFLGIYFRDNETMLDIISQVSKELAFAREYGEGGEPRALFEKMLAAHRQRMERMNDILAEKTGVLHREHEREEAIVRANSASEAVARAVRRAELIQLRTMLLQSDERAARDSTDSESRAESLVQRCVASEKRLAQLRDERIEVLNRKETSLASDVLSARDEITERLRALDGVANAILSARTEVVRKDDELLQANRRLRTEIVGRDEVISALTRKLGGFANGGGGAGDGALEQGVRERPADSQAPKPPGPPLVVDVAPTSVELLWGEDDLLKPRDDTSRPSSYVVQLSEASKGEYETTYQGPGNEATMDNLTPGTRYKARARAVFAGGIATGWSEAAVFWTPTGDKRVDDGLEIGAREADALVDQVLGELNSPPSGNDASSSDAAGAIFDRLPIAKSDSADYIAPPVAVYAGGGPSPLGLATHAGAGEAEMEEDDDNDDDYGSGGDDDGDENGSDDDLVLNAVSRSLGDGALEDLSDEEERGNSGENAGDGDFYDDEDEDDQIMERLSGRLGPTFRRQASQGEGDGDDGQDEGNIDQDALNEGDSDDSGEFVVVGG